MAGALALGGLIALALAGPGAENGNGTNKAAAGSGSAAGGRHKATAGGSSPSNGDRNGGGQGGAAPSLAPAGREAVPGRSRAAILMYHVINPPPPGAPFPGLYVTRAELAEQMQSLHAAGYVAVTLEQLAANWREGRRLPAGKPVVITFDNGYRSQYQNALPVLEALHWAGVENIQLSGLPPAQGGISEPEVRGLLNAGWELDTQGYSHADLPSLSPAALRFQVAAARRTLQARYHVPVNWFCYPSGHYDAAVIAEVKAAGFTGSTTVIPGWASAGSDSYRLPRLRVLGGTSGRQLLVQVAAASSEAPPPAVYR